MTTLRDRVLVANRGEIAVRIARGARAAGMEPVAIYSADDATAPHALTSKLSHALPGSGPAAYLDIAEVVEAAVANDCMLVHPGYGFLSENAEFARACKRAGLVFVGPSPEALDLFGDKAAARAFAEEECGVPVVPGQPVDQPSDVDVFMKEIGGGPVMIKAVAGGGGRGIRLVEEAEDVANAFEQCKNEATLAFGLGDLYVEQFLPRVRHIEVQVVADNHGAVLHLWDRDCSVQRNNQKIVEIAPALAVDESTRQQLWDDSVAMAKRAGYSGLGTFEFLVWSDADGSDRYAFIEANARLQVEHTVTEMITGADLVRSQLQVAAGQALEATEAWKASRSEPVGTAVQVRVNAEKLLADGRISAGAGTIGSYTLPSGPGIRVDGAGYDGYTMNPRFDSLLAKVITHVPESDVSIAFQRSRDALLETRISGVDTNVDLLWAILDTPEDRQDFHTRYIDEHRVELLAHAADYVSSVPGASGSDATATAAAADTLREDTASVQWMRAATHGAVVRVLIAVGDEVRRGTELVVLESMKMEHSVTATTAGTVTEILVKDGDGVGEQHALVAIAVSDHAESDDEVEVEVDLDEIRPDLAEVIDRQRYLLDENRAKATKRRHDAGRLTAREIVAGLTDEGTFREYGSLVVAARQKSTPIEQLLQESPADGLITGTAQVNGDLFTPHASRAVVAAYDYTVYAGTQGQLNHDKLDRVFAIAERTSSPVVLWAEGGGGRGSDTDNMTHTPETFHQFAQMSGKVPLVGVVGGRCFAGNAVLLGCCDVVIATEGSTIGLGGPVMVEGGGLGQFTPEEIGPMSTQVANGVVDILVEDDTAALAAARKYLSYFQGIVGDWEAPDQRLLRHVVPDNRMKSYDMHTLIDIVADTDSFLELRAGFGRALITGFIRIEGIPFGVIANNPAVLGGAIDRDASDKSTRFMQLCDAHGIPILSLCDTPGNMVGPEAEAEALVRHCSRPFVVGANLTVPIFAVLVRKAYGLGRQAMLGGSMRAPNMAIAWPGAEYGAMGLEGQVKVGRKRELEAIKDLDERERVFRGMVDELLANTRAIRTASVLQVDEVIDPAATRAWIVDGITAAGLPDQTRGRRAYVDTW